MKRQVRTLVRELEAAGWAHVDTNCKGALRYGHPAGSSLLVNPSADEHAVRRLRALAGLEEQRPKRSATAVKERQAKERERCRRQQLAHQAGLDGLVAEKARMLAGHGATLRPSEVLRLEREIERAEREVARLTALMTEVPASADHAGNGRARHRAGAS